MALKKIFTIVFLLFPVFGKSLSLRSEVSYSNMSIADSTSNSRLFNGVQAGLSALYIHHSSNRLQSFLHVIGLGVNYEYLHAISNIKSASNSEFNPGLPILKLNSRIDAIYASVSAGFLYQAKSRLAFEILGSFDYAFFVKAKYSDSSILPGVDSLTMVEPKLKYMLSSTTINKAYNYGVQFATQYLLTQNFSIGAALSWKIVRMNFVHFDYEDKESEVKESTGRTILTKLFLQYNI